MTTDLPFTNKTFELHFEAVDREVRASLMFQQPFFGHHGNGYITKTETGYAFHGEKDSTHQPWFEEYVSYIQKSLKTFVESNSEITKYQLLEEYKSILRSRNLPEPSPELYRRIRLDEAL